MGIWTTENGDRECAVCDYEVDAYWLFGENAMCELCYDRSLEAGEDPAEDCEYYAALKN